ncbi:MAG: ABC transporter ATP-binding protein [Spirochaeta sp.]|nr:ABC transporter ATP-binding protein [Spirochaeta sp.]
MTTFQETSYHKRLDLALWREILRRTRAYTGLIVRLAVVMVLAGGIDAAYPLLNRYAIDTFIVPQDVSGLWWFGLIYLAAILLQCGNIWMLINIAGTIELRLMHDLRREAFVHIQHLSFSYFDRTPVGWLTSRLTSDVQRLGETISWGIVDIIWGSATMTAIVVIMVVLHPFLALLVLVVVPPLAVVSVVFQRRILASQREVRKTNSEISAAFTEGIAGAPTSKVLAREEENAGEFALLTGKMRTQSVRAALRSALYLPIVLLLASVGTGIAVSVGGYRLSLGGISPGTLVAFIGYSVFFFEPVREVARVLTELQAAQSAAERIVGLINTPAEIVDTPEVTARFGTVLEPKRAAWPPCRGEITFRDVSFQYPDGERVLSNFDLTVPAGQSIAIVGPTGAGKTTIVNLACRFYEPTSGVVEIDGVDYRRRSIGWIQSHLGYVLQAPHLFRGTVRDNIRYGRLEATDGEIVTAANSVGADEMIRALSRGYDTEVGEGGAGLSTGEKQLVSFARAVLANPAIFVLDEATSSIDTETELRIQRATQALLQGRTSFVIAHRLSTIR